MGKKITGHIGRTVSSKHTVKQNILLAEADTRKKHPPLIRKKILYKTVIADLVAVTRLPFVTDQRSVTGVWLALPRMCTIQHQSVQAFTVW